MSPPADPAELARQLERAMRTREPLLPLSETGAVETLEQAYAVQSEWEKLRLAAGDRILGRKVGLTSLAMQKQFGVDEPDFGGLWESRHYPAPGGRARVAFEPFLQPRIEGEIAFRLGAPLAGPGVTAEQVLEATEGLAVAAEIIDSRIENWRIELVDTVSDNGSFGGFVLGAWDPGLRDADPEALRLRVRRNGELVQEGLASAVLGHPARSVAWLVNKLSEFGRDFEGGEIVLSGSLVAATEAALGDEFSIELSGQDPLIVAFG